MPWPDDLVTPVYVLVSPDWDRDQFRIRRSTVPSSPSGFEALCECFIHSLAGKTVQRGDVVTVNGRFSTVHYGPDLQGDMQVMFNDVYPEFFPISGDLNIKDTGVNVGRYLTTVVMLMTILSFIACSMCFLCLCTEALASLVPLCNNVAFKAYILFLVLFASLGFYCLMVRVPSAFWKKRFYRSLQFVPTTVMCFCIVLFGAHEFDLHCTQDHWQPMIKIVAQLYAPDDMNVTDLQGYLGYVAFNPLVRTPTLQLPTMERSIPHDELLERSEYYDSEIFFLILVTCFLVELLSRLFTIFLKRWGELS